jgi:MFS family permease
MSSSADTRSFVETNYRWNFSVNVLDISFYMLALNMVSQTTILPLMVSQLTGSKFAVGLIPAIFSMGFFLPQLLTAGYTEGLKLKKPFIMLFSGITERGPYLIIGLIIWLFAKPAPVATLVAFYLLLLLAAGTAGILTPAWYDMIAKVIPVERRGLYSGVGNGLGAFMGIAGAALAGWLLTRFEFPVNYALCFLVASVFFVVSWVGLALNREPESETVKEHNGLLVYLKQLPALLRRDHNLQAFLFSRSMANLGGMASGFFIVYGAEKFGVSGAEAGVLTAILVGSQALWNLLWGLLGDQKGHKIVLVGSTFAMALAALAAVLAQSAIVMWLVFFLVGVALAGDSVSGLNIILEFCEPEDRPTYIGLTNTLLSPVKTLSPLIGGWLATWLGYPPMFVVAVVVTVVGTLMLQGWVKEPRHAASPNAKTLPETQ